MSGLLVELIAQCSHLSAWSSTPIDGPLAGLMIGEHSSSHQEESKEEIGYRMSFL